MADTDVNVRITAQVDSLQGGAQAAQDSFKGIRMSADEARAALLAAGGSWDQLAKTQYAAEQAAKAAAAAQVTAGAAATGAATATTGIRVATAGAIQEYVRLGHEIMQGNFSRIPGTIVVTASRMGGLQTVVQALSGVWGLVAAGVLAFAGALAYLTVKEIEAANATNEVMAAVALHNVDLGKEQIAGYIQQVEKMSGSSYSTAAEVVRSFAEMKNANGPLIAALIDQVERYAQATGEKLPEAAKKLAAMFNDLDKNGEKTLQTFGASRAEIAAFNTAVQHGDVVGEYTIALTALNASTLRVQESTRATSAELNAAWAIINGLRDADINAAAGMDKLALALKKVRDAQAGQSGQDVGPAASATGAAAGPTGIPLDEMRANMAQMEAVNQDSQSVLLQQEIASWQKRIQVGDLYGKELTAANDELAKLQVALIKQTGSELISDTQDTVAKINATEGLGRAQQLQQASAAWAKLVQDHRLTAEQHKNVEKEYWNSVAAIDREGQSEQNAIQKSNASTAVELSRLRLEGAKADIQSEIAAHQDGAAREYETLKQLATEEERLDEQGYQAIITSDTATVAEKNDAYNQIKVLRAKLDETLKGYDKDEVQAAERAAQQESQAWRTAVGEITSAEDTLVKDIFTKRQSLTQDLIGMSSQLVQKEIEDDLKYYTTKLLYLALGLTAEKGAAQGGLLVHALGEITKTLDTGVGVAARTAYEQSGNASFIALATQKAAKWAYTETTETAATATGVTTRTASQVAGDATTAASAAVTAKAGIMKHAASAAAAVYDDVAQIPYVGWILAPPAAAIAFAAVAAFGSGISAEGGAWDTGSQGGMLQYHPHETVLPAAVAQPMRQFFSGGGAQQGSGDSYGITIQAIDTLTGAQFLKNNAGVIIASLALAKRNGNSAFSPGV